MKHTYGQKITSDNLNRITNAPSSSYVIYQDGDNIYGECSLPGGSDIPVSTNAKTVLQAAVDNLPSSGGKIFIKSGRYYVSGITLPSYTTIEGELPSIEHGYTGTELILPNSANTDMFINELRDGTEIGITLRNLVMDGNPTNNTSGNGVNFQNTFAGSLFRLDNVTIRNFRGCNVYFDAVKDFWIVNSKITESYSHCIAIINGSRDGWIIGVDCGGSVNGHGIYALDSYALFFESVVFDNNALCGMRIENAGEHTVNNCRSGGNTERGIMLVSTTRNNVTNCSIYNNVIHGITLHDSTKNLVAENNIFDNRVGGARTQQHAIIEEGTASDYNSINNNVALDNLTSPPVSIYGHESRAINNLGYNPVGKIVNVFDTTNDKIELQGDAAVPVSTKTYTVCHTDIYVNSTDSGGADCDIAIKDGGGNLVYPQSGTVSSLNGIYVPVGYQVTWGTFSGADPTVLVTFI